MSEEGLPEGWVECTMGDIADVVGGGTPKASDPVNFAARGHPWITPADLSRFRDVYIQRGSRDLSDQGLRTSSAKMVPAGTVLMSSRAPIGYLAIAANPVSTNQGFRSFICKPGIHPEFIYYWLMHSRDLIEEMGSGSTFTEISGSRCKEIPFRFPSVVEQKRIAAKLKELFAVANATRERLARVPALLKRFRQAVLAAACEGRLTEPWRVTQSDSGTNSEHELPSGWQRFELGRFVESMANGIYKPAQYYVEKGVPCLRMYNIQDGHLNFNNVKRMRLTPSETKTYELLPGDILVNRVNSRELVGKAGIVEPLAERTVFESKNIRVRLIHQQISARFVNLFLMTGSARTALSDSSKQTVGMATVNQPQLGALSLAVPPLPEQEEIVRRVEALFKLADAIEKRVAVATARAEKLTQAILAKAFRGELVPTEAELAHREGRGYEPAADLLERIARTRAL